MIGWWSRAPIRIRLTAWYTAVLSLMLVVYAAATFITVRREFHEQFEEADIWVKTKTPVLVLKTDNDIPKE